MLVLSHVLDSRADAPTAGEMTVRRHTTAELPSLSRLQPRRQSWLLVFPGRANPLQSLLSCRLALWLKTSLQTAVTYHALAASQHGQIQFQRLCKQPPFGQPPPLGFPFVALGHFAGDACRNCKRTRGFRHLFALRLRFVYLDQIGSVHATSTGCKRNGPLSRWPPLPRAEIVGRAGGRLSRLPPTAACAFRLGCLPWCPLPPAGNAGLASGAATPAVDCACRRPDCWHAGWMGGRCWAGCQSPSPLVLNVRGTHETRRNQQHDCPSNQRPGR